MRILHILRAPLGGLYRHVLDLSEAQIAMGHEVGIVVDAHSFNDYAHALVQPIEARLTLGLHQVPMVRSISLFDLKSMFAVGSLIRQIAPDVVHGHGAKGGAYARLFGGSRTKVYTPHGGSANYSDKPVVGFILGLIERILYLKTNVIIFESHFAQKVFFQFLGSFPERSRVVFNGLKESEFSSHQPTKDSDDIIFIGEIHQRKGVDVLLDAVALLHAENHKVRLSIVGSGSHEAASQDRAAALGLSSYVTFHGRMPARQAFQLGKILVIPSRYESMPYIVLEALAARVPLIATSVGGIPEILGVGAPDMVPAGDAALLSLAIRNLRLQPAELREARSLALQQRIRELFSANQMAQNILKAYQDFRA